MPIIVQEGGDILLKNLYLRLMFLVLFIGCLFCILTYCDIDLFGGSSSRNGEFSPIETTKYTHKGTKSSPLSISSSDTELYTEMLKSIHNGERDFYISMDGNSIKVYQKRLSEILSFYMTANQSIYPTLVGVCSYQYESLDGNSVQLTLSDISGSGDSAKNGYKRYQKLRNYVSKDIDSLYADGILKKSMSDKEKSMVISKYIAQNVQYDKKVAANARGPFSYNSTAGSKVHNPLGFYEGWDLVCDGYAALYNVFMWELGIESYIVTSSNHAWNLAYLDGKWYHTDVTYSDPVTYDRNGKIGATLEFQEEYINLTYTQIKGIDSDHTLSKHSKHFINTYLGLNY